MFTVCVHCMHSTTRYVSTRFTSRQSGRWSLSMFRAAMKRWRCSLDYRSDHWLLFALYRVFLKWNIIKQFGSSQRCCLWRWSRTLQVLKDTSLSLVPLETPFRKCWVEKNYLLICVILITLFAVSHYRLLHDYRRNAADGQ